jgi:hypothetical protein
VLDVVVVVVVEADEIVVVVVVVLDVDELVTVDVVLGEAVVVVVEQSRKLPLSLPFDPLPWLSLQFPCASPLWTHGSPP